MDTQVSKNMLYKTRTLAGRLTSSFGFLKNNLSLFIKLSFYILCPLVVIQSILNAIIIIYPQFYFSIGYFVVGFLILIISMIGNCIYGSLIYSLIQQYAENNYIPLYKNLKPLHTILLKNAGKVFIVICTVMAIFFLLLALTFLLGYLTYYTLLLTVPLILFLIIPLNYIPYVYLFEKKSWIDSLKKSFKIGIKYWSSTFAILFIMVMLSLFILMIIGFPLIFGYNIAIQAYQAILAGENGSLPFYFPYLIFILSCIYLLSMYFSQLLIIVPMAFQYGNAEAVERGLDINHQSL